MRAWFVGILISSVASAQPPNLFVDGGVVVGNDSVSPAFAGLTVEGGIRLRGPLWARGEVLAGEPLSPPDNSHTGSYQAVRLGVEHHLCTQSSVACLVSGLDVGWRRYQADEDTVRGVELVPQVGLDIGGSRLRFRTALQGVVALGAAHQSAYLQRGDELPFFDGVLVTFAIAYQH